MKKSILIISVGVILNNFCFAGGNFVPVITEPVEIEEANEYCLYLGLGAGIQRTYGDGADWFSDTILAQDKTVPIVGVLGCKINTYLAVEGRISQSVYEEDYADVTTYSIFLKPMYPVTDEFTIYGLLGYGNVDVDGTDGNTPAFKKDGQNIADKNSFQWGFGASYLLSEDFSLFVDYTRLMSEASIPLQPLYEYEYRGTWNDKLSDDVITVGITYQF